MRVIGTPQPTDEELAARIRGGWEENRQWLTRPEWAPRERRVELFDRIAALRYKFRPSSDRLVALAAALNEGSADCKALAAGYHAVLETLLPAEWEIESVLIEGGTPEIRHAAMRLRRNGAGGEWEYFDPSLDAGMPDHPPLKAYAAPDVVVIASRACGPF